MPFIAVSLSTGNNRNGAARVSNAYLPYQDKYWLKDPYLEPTRAAKNSLGIYSQVDYDSPEFGTQHLGDDVEGFSKPIFPGKAK